MHYLYQIQNKRTNRNYYGVSEKPFHRFKQHLKDLASGRHHNDGFQADFEAPDGLEMSFLAHSESRAAALREETTAIKGDSNCYNISKKAKRPQAKKRRYDRLDEVMDEFNLTQANIAEISGCSPQAISNMFTRNGVSKKVLFAVADFLHLDYREMWIGTIEGVEIVYPRKAKAMRGTHKYQLKSA